MDGEEAKIAGVTRSTVRGGRDLELEMLVEQQLQNRTEGTVC